MTARLKGSVLATFAIVAGACCTLWAYQEWQASAQLGAGKEAMARGDHPGAARHFARVLARWPGHDEAAYWLGWSEQANGRLDAALAAWERIGADSPFAGLSAVRIAPIALERGQFARAEDLLRRALRDAGPQSAEARELLGRVLRFEDRRDEARDLLREEIRQAIDPAPVLHELWMLDSEAVAVDRTRAMFEKAARDAPDDDRVRLGLANLALRSGRLDETVDRLRSCLVARPEDPAVWRAWLAWAQAADRAGEVLKALAHLSPARFTEGEVLALRAWLAARTSDPETDRRELERLADRDPASPGALERLAAMNAREGRADRVEALRLKKAELDRARRRYDELMEAGPEKYSALAPEMAGLAETLGRPIEAWGWWALVFRTRPSSEEARAALARLDLALAPATKEGTAAGLVADLAPSALVDRLPKVSGPGVVATRPVFTDDAGSAGLRMIFDHDPSPDRRLPETMSGGVGLLDYDGDGWLDVYCVQGGPLGPVRGRASTGDRLFHNRGDGTFEDASELSGIAAMPRGYGHGVAVGDVDGDGRPDLFVTRLGSYALYRNRGDGTFEDRTLAAGLGGDRGWPTSAAFADLDGDGDLDLYVCHYVRWSFDHPARCRDPETARPTYCEPQAFEAEPDRLFRNDGGRFVDVSDEAGIVDRDGRGLGVVAVDLDGDGLQDLFVANDTTSNFAFFNRGGLRFREGAALESGLAANASGGFLAGMGVACGDPDGDGRPDLAVTNFYNESTTLYRNLGAGSFSDDGAASGITLPSRYLLGFGIAFLDYDDDGRLDLVSANGHVNDSRPLYPYAMPALLLAGDGSGRFADVTTSAGPPLTTPRVGRGLAVGDLDNDGRVDLLIVSQGEHLAYLHNRTPGGHSLVLRLEGTRSNHDAVGARVVVTSGGRRWTAWRFGGGSYLSTSDPRLHFGLGDQDRAETVEVSWPSGKTDRFKDLDAAAGYLLREGQPAPEPLDGFPIEANRPRPKSRSVPGR